MEEPKLLTLKQAQTYILATFNPQIRWGVLRAACANGKLKAGKRRFAGQRAPGNQLWLVAQAELDAFMLEELAAEGRPRSGAPRGVSYARPRNVKGRPTNLGPSRKILIDLPLSELTLIDQDIKAGLASSRNELFSSSSKKVGRPKPDIRSTLNGWL